MPNADLTTVFHFMSAGNLGGFASKLAEAWFAADSKNRMKIELAFPELVERARSAKAASDAGNRRLAKLEAWMKS